MTLAKRISKAGKPRITHARLLEMVRFDPASGVFTNLVGGQGRPPIGAQAGALKSRGYRCIDLDGARYPEHVLAWFYTYCKWPQDSGLHIDHINGDRSDNRLVNLRLATDTENQRNRTVNKTNTLGLKGVSTHCDPRRTKRYGARIKVNYQTIHLGWFATPEEAHAAYCAGATKYFGEFARAA